MTFSVGYNYTPSRKGRGAFSVVLRRFKVNGTAVTKILSLTSGNTIFTISKKVDR